MEIELSRNLTFTITKSGQGLILQFDTRAVLLPTSRKWQENVHIHPVSKVPYVSDGQISQPCICFFQNPVDYMKKPGMGAEALPGQEMTVDLVGQALTAPPRQAAVPTAGAALLGGMVAQIGGRGLKSNSPLSRTVQQPRISDIILFKSCCCISNLVKGFLRRSNI